jgi:hypothetical protein
VTEIDRRRSGTKARHTGNAGELAVMSAVEKLGWGTIPNSISDDGTDVLAFAKSRDLVPLRLMVAMQVKTGRSWFRSPPSVSGSPSSSVTDRKV